MTKNFSKKLIAVSMLLFLITTTLVPCLAFAKTGTLGTETPEIAFTFKDSKNEVADGNSLKSGDYNVNINLSGMETASLFQLTANYDSNVVTSIEVTSLYSDSADMTSMGTVCVDNNFVIGMVSDNDDTSTISKSGTVMATVAITIASTCDFADVFTVSTDPDLTFAQADYGDGMADSYVLDTTATTESGAKLYPMTCDVSPDMSTKSLNINGKVVVSTDSTGKPTTVGIVGITVSVDVNGKAITAVTNESGEYTLQNVPEGTYTMNFTGDTTIDRTATLIVSSKNAIDGAITVDNIGIVICDYNRDGVIAASDYSQYIKSLNDNYYIYCDFNGDGMLSSADTSSIFKLLNVQVTYNDIELQ